MVSTGVPAPSPLTLTRSFYSPGEVAAFADVSTSTILKYIKAGKLHAVALSERTIRIPRKSVVRFLEMEEPAPVVIDRSEADISL